MPEILIVSWPQSTIGDKINSATSVKWHFVADEADCVTLCDCTLPVPLHRRYATIRTEEMTNIKGFCFNCFHNVCINQQSKHLWTIYQCVEDLNSCFSQIEGAIKSSKCSSLEINSALVLYQQLLSHSVIKSITGE